MKEIRCRNEQDTAALARQLAQASKPGDIIALIGELGTGKTTLTRYIARALGIGERITSPTFTIVKEYHSGRIPLYHFDVYRVSDPDELFEIGCEEYFYGTGLCIIEWADLIEDILPAETKKIRILPGQTEQERIVQCEC